MVYRRLLLPEKAQLILLRLLDLKGDVVKSSLLKIVPNVYALENNLKLLEKNRLIRIREEVVIRRAFYISLTEKGKAVAEQIMSVEDLIAGTHLFQREENVEEPGDRFLGILKYFSALYKIDISDNIMMKEISSNKSIGICMKYDDRNIPRLWCQLDGSFECFHVKYAWAMNEVQEFYFKKISGIIS